jgi:hypothetical protein
MIQDYFTGFGKKLLAKVPVARIAGLPGISISGKKAA